MSEQMQARYERQLLQWQHSSNYWYSQFSLCQAERDALRRQAEQAEARVAHLTEVNDKLVEQLDRAERALDKEGETAEALSHALREIDRLAMALGRTEMEALGLRARLTAREAGE